jgi:putative aldouronate transport system permease protein
MTAKMFINNKGLYPIQMKLYEIVVQSQMQDMVNPGIGVVLPTTTRSIQLATIVVTALPIVLVYPFLQKYFVSGMTLGAVKE